MNWPSQVWDGDPSFTAWSLLFGLCGLLLLLVGLRRLARARIGSGLFGVAMGLALLLGAGLVMVFQADVRSYRRLSAEQPAGEVRFRARADRDFDATLTYPDGSRAVFELRGDEWQVDARVVKWRPLATVLGFDALYRLERIGGRYESIDDERSQPRTVFALNPPARWDLWEIARRHPDWFPGVDALYGSATYLPMTDDALYAITVSQSGLVARPVNPAARAAMGRWH